MSETPIDMQEFALIDVFTGETKRTFRTLRAGGSIGKMLCTYRLNFSDFEERRHLLYQGRKYCFATLPHQPSGLSRHCRLLTPLYASATLWL